jgi:hypothetical protein
MTGPYQVVSRDDTGARVDSEQLAQLLAKDGQLLLPMLDLIEHAECAIDDLIDVMGRDGPPSKPFSR